MQHKKIKHVHKLLKEIKTYDRNIKDWTNELFIALKDHKVTEFGKSLKLENIKIESVNEKEGILSASLEVGKIIFNVKFTINKIEEKIIGSVIISSPEKKGNFTVKAENKNTEPDKMIKIMSDIFSLKYKK